MYLYHLFTKWKFNKASIEEQECIGSHSRHPVLRGLLCVSENITECKSPNGSNPGFTKGTVEIWVMLVGLRAYFDTQDSFDEMILLRCREWDQEVREVEEGKRIHDYEVPNATGT
jgi:hypothetical protein